MSEIFLLRHGQATFEKSNYDHLSEKGFKQADYLAEFLRDSGIRFDSIYIGENLRHRQTMEPSEKLLKEGGKIKVLKAFTEFEFGEVMREVIPYMKKNKEGFSLIADRMFESNSDFQKAFEMIVFEWLDKQDKFKAAKWSDFLKRVEDGIRKVIKDEGPGKNVGIFTSGGVIAAVVQSILKISEKETLKISWQILNASVTRIKYGSKGVGLCSLNEAGFLAVKEGMITYR